MAVTQPIALTSRQAGLKPGDVIDSRYVVRECIGEGGVGSVFLADQLTLGRSVVIKVLLPDLAIVPDLASKMHEEAMLACHVRSPHCVEVFDCGVLPDGTPYIVMEYVPGRSLGRVIADEAMTLVRALDVFDQILSALAATHRSGIVHGDVKSDNFLVECVQGTDHVTMIDFGLAHVIGGASSSGLSADEVVISGTPEYMAPEVAAGGTPLPASDLYGAGVILYELLTGTTPFGGGSTFEILLRQVRDRAMPPSQCTPERGIPAEIDRVVLRALHKRPEARFPSAAAFADALREAAGAPGGTRSRTAVFESSATSPWPGRTASAPRSRRRLARGSECSTAVSGDPAVFRRQIGEALRRGDVPAIAEGYLALANALVARHQFARATSELQEGIDILTMGGDPRESEAPRSVEPLVVALAALYDDAGDPRHARRLAASTDRSPTWTYAIGGC